MFQVKKETPLVQREYECSKNPLHLHHAHAPVPLNRKWRYSDQIVFERNLVMGDNFSSSEIYTSTNG